MTLTELHFGDGEAHLYFSEGSRRKLYTIQLGNLSAEAQTVIGDALTFLVGNVLQADEQLSPGDLILEYQQGGIITESHTEETPDGPLIMIDTVRDLLTARISVTSPDGSEVRIITSETLPPGLRDGLLATVATVAQADRATLEAWG